MLFRAEVCLKRNLLQAVLRAAIYHLKSSHCSENKHSGEKASRCTSPGRKGSLTVEAALVCSLFLFCVTALLHLFVLQELRSEIDRALTDAGKELSQDAYFADDWEEVTGTAAVWSYGKHYLKNYLEGRKTAGLIVGDINGVSLLGSGWNEEDSLLTLRAIYRVRMPVGLTDLHPIWVVQSKKVRGWSGFHGRGAAGNLSEEELVYVTEYGEVYHRKLDCRHLKLSIRQSTFDEVSQLRNSEGARYYPCEYCWGKEQSFLYITDDGNRYHATLHCQGLSRGIRTLRLSQTGGLPPCSVCGGT